jgi:hypothetical protein
MSTAIEPVDMEKKAEQEMSPVLAKARDFSVTDAQTYADADAICAEIKRRVEDRKAELGPMKESATKAWKAAVAVWKRFVDDPLEAVKTLDRKRYAWKKEEERKAAEEAERIRREAEKKEQEERLKLAERLEAANMTEQAEKILDAPLPSVETHYVLPVAKVTGQSQSENWQVCVIQEHLLPREYLMADMVKINKVVKLMKGKTNIPGVFVQDVGKTTRR